MPNLIDFRMRDLPSVSAWPIAGNTVAAKAKPLALLKSRRLIFE
jgi:hypothetical protein